MNNYMIPDQKFPCFYYYGIWNATEESLDVNKIAVESHVDCDEKMQPIIDGAKENGCRVVSPMLQSSLSNGV